MGSKIGSIIIIFLVNIGLCNPSVRAQNTRIESEYEVGLRMIGHQVLLLSNDSTSTVLPIVKEGEHYRIVFNTEFSFIPEELVASIAEVVHETQLAKRYIVELEACESGEVIYSFKIDESAQSDIVPCQSRVQEKACYTILFYNLDEDLDAAILTPAANAAGGSNLNNSVTPVVTIALALLLSGLFFFLWKQRSKSQTQPDLIPLGTYHFDKRNVELIKDNVRIQLTSKEADLLLLLNNSANTTVAREELLNKVWGDDGEYIGRTLDVFISKLRKKLKADPRIKIINTRGVGYKLVTSN